MNVASLSSSSKRKNSKVEAEEEEELQVDIVRAAMEGNEKIFEDPNLSDEDLLRTSTSSKYNILLIAIRYKQRKFLRKLLDLKKPFGFYNKLFTERDSQGDTPLHVGIEFRNRDVILMLLRGYMDMYDEEKGEPLWRAKNHKGNNLLHVALLRRDLIVAQLLLRRDPGLARIVNYSKEAPLHLAVTHLQRSDMVRELLEEARGVASWHDAKGFTPLLRAAPLSYKSLGGFMYIIQDFIEYCPESTLVCDASGKSLLHHLSQHQFLRECTDWLLCHKEIRILVNYQDHDGNTPLHIVAESRNLHMMRSIIFSSYSDKSFMADLNLTNNNGFTAESMLQQQNLYQQLHEQRSMTDEELNLANKGDLIMLQNIAKDTQFYGSRHPTGSNFLHLFMKRTSEHPYHLSTDHCKKCFDTIKLAILNQPQLICQTDETGNTPIHYLSQNKDFCKIMANIITRCGEPTESHLTGLLSLCAGAITKIRERVNNDEADNQELVWVKQNLKGNTPLHEAIIANNKVMVLELLSYCEESARLVNKHKETPLHLVAKTDTGMEEFTVDEIIELVKAHFEALGLQDQDGLTPLSRALQANNPSVVVTLLCNTPEFRDTTSGHTKWQIFVNNLPSKFLDKLLEIEAFKKMLELKNKDGNTPLHVAIQEKRFVFVHDLLLKCSREHDESSEDDNRWLMDLLRIPNHVGETPEDLLADMPTLPRELEDKLLNDRNIRGIRSSWRIPRTQLQNYMNSMNIIAALQTTITFTAAFTVPGGLMGDIGAPVLIRHLAFQIFMMSDVIAMCLSMMVLVCLLWMVATNKRDSVMLQDFALLLLLASFIATLLTFMTGVYVTIYPFKPWIAITTLALCSLLILLLHRFMLIKLLLLLKYRKVSLFKKIRRS